MPRVKDPNRKSVEELEVDVVMEQVVGLVAFRIVVSAGSAMEAFSVSIHPNLVNYSFWCILLQLESLFVA